MATNAHSNDSVQHPQDNVEAQALYNLIMKHDASNGAAVHSFDPDTSPKQKAAAAGKLSDQLKSITQQDGSAQGEKGVFLFPPRQP